jgi:hypothetical protein
MSDEQPTKPDALTITITIDSALLDGIPMTDAQIDRFVREEATPSLEVLIALCQQYASGELVTMPDGTTIQRTAP